MPVSIDAEKCIGCNKCYTICPMDIFAIDEETKKPKVEYGFECWHCGVCWMECPVRAIDVTLPCSMW